MVVVVLVFAVVLRPLPPLPLLPARPAASPGPERRVVLVPPVPDEPELALLGVLVVLYHLLLHSPVVDQEELLRQHWRLVLVLVLVLVGAGGAGVARPVVAKRQKRANELPHFFFFNIRDVQHFTTICVRKVQKSLRQLSASKKNN